MQQINDYTGKLTIGHNVKIGYFAQNQAQLLDEELTVYQTIDYVATGDWRLKIRDILGAFMFGGDDIDKKVKVLSGGERTRLAMIKLLLQPVNFLILDEPTNHLDMRSKDVLKEAISQFEGTVIVVSHDRDFLDGLVQKVYEFGGGKVKEHLGGIYDFLREKHEQLLRQGTEANVSERGLDALFTQKEGANKSAAEGSKQPKAGALSYAEQKEFNKKLKKAERMVENCEVTISETESAISILEAQMATPKGAADMSLYEKHQRLKQALDKAMEEWEVASEELEKLKQQQ
jgi:ATP-binding cassette subfamily F protein 3